VVEGTLRAYYFQLRLSVEDYEFPHFNTGRDGNALACQVVVEDTEIGDSYLRHSPTLYNFELASFTERLRALQREGSGQAVLGDADAESGDEFGLTISLSDGTGTLAGFVGNKAGARLGFGPIDIDHSFVADALALFDDIIETFPPFAATSPPTEPRHQRGWESILDRRSPGESCQLRH
jgi:hypothetical protein